MEALEEALRKEVPEIFNTDQGVQFTSEAFTGLLQKYGVRESARMGREVTMTICLSRDYGGQ